MKNRILIRLAFLTIPVLLVGSCETDIEKAQNDYKATQLIPKIVSTTGATTVLQTFEYPYKVSYSRAGSVWTWTATDATIKSTSADTKSIVVLFNTKPASDTAKIKVIETTSAGVVSPEKVIKVKVKPFCPLAVTGFVGSWGGTDGYSADMFPSEVVTSAPSGSTIKLYGLNKGWMEGYWGETITDGGTLNMTINNDGTASIAEQYLFTTIYDGDPYVYWIKNAVITWDACGAHPAMIISYNVYYKSDNYQLPSNTTKTLKFTATIVMDGTKGGTANIVAPKLSSDELRALKKRN